MNAMMKKEHIGSTLKIVSRIITKTSMIMLYLKVVYLLPTVKFTYDNGY